MKTLSNMLPLFASLLCLLISLSAMAQTPTERRQFKMPQITTSPTIDGDISDEVWKGAFHIEPV
jgi:hypothetical protein